MRIKNFKKITDTNQTSLIANIATKNLKNIFEEELKRLSEYKIMQQMFKAVDSSFFTFLVIATLLLNFKKISYFLSSENNFNNEI